MRNFYLLTLILICISISSEADIIRVNNNNGISADFSNLQTALDSANAGDTIYLEPSSTSYGNVTIGRRVSIYGPGFFLAENSGQQANVNTSKIGTLTFDAGADFSSISGVEISEVNLNSGNIAITRCRILAGTGIRFNGSNSNTNVLIAQNYIEGSLTNGTGFQTYTVFFRNNFLDGNASLEPTIVCDFTNNIIDFTSAGGVENSVFINNIFRTASSFYDPGDPAYNNGFENNIFVNSPINVDSALGNQKGVNLSQVFQGTANNSTDGAFQIIPGSAADDTGKQIPAGTPTDIGMFGGPNPYKLAGVPAIPTIYDLVVPTSNTNGGLNITIRAKSQE